MIDERAIIHPTAKIAPDVEIGPFSIIGAEVEIGAGSWVGPHVVLQGPTKIGKNNKIFQFSSIGEAPQDKKYHGEQSILEIGDNNTFREYVTVSRGTEFGGGITKIGNNNLLMAHVHIAHDCIVADNIIFSNQASLAGHVTVQSFANLGGFVGVRQFCTIGAYSFCAGGSIIVKDVMPYVIVSGYPAEAHGLNVIGMRRRNMPLPTQNALKKAYKNIFRLGLTTEEAAVALAPLALEYPEVERMIAFMKAATRGITR